MSLPLTVVGGALVWNGHMEIDCDGAPNAYAEPPLVGLDYLANAGGPGNWYGVVTNMMGQPIVQGPSDPCPGYYVSQTALVDPSKLSPDPNRYVNALTVPYITMTRLMRTYGVHLSDLAWVLYRAQAGGAVVADVGPHPGEGSVCLASMLGIPSNPKHGGVDAGVSYVVFPGSGTGWPRDLADIQTTARLLFERWGGADKLDSLLNAPPVA